MAYRDLVERSAETELANLWPVYGSYEVRDDGLLWQTSAVVEREYPPLDHPQILADLAKTSDGSRAAVESFARRWGALGYTSLIGVESSEGVSASGALGRDIFEQHRALQRVRWELAKRNVGEEIRRDPMDWIVAHGRGVVLCLRLLELLHPADDSEFQASALREFLRSLRRIQRGNSMHRLGKPQVVNPDQLSDDAMADFGAGHEISSGRWSFEGDPEEAARQIIADIVTANTRGIGPRLVLADRRLLRVESYDALVQVAYWHLAGIAESNELLARCESPDCRAFFIKRDGRQRFCSPDPWAGAESRCARRFRAQKATRGDS